MNMALHRTCALDHRIIVVVQKHTCILKLYLKHLTGFALRIDIINNNVLGVCRQ